MDDEQFYQIVSDELRNERINDALWTKAIARSMGDDKKTKAIYIQLRVKQLMQEATRARVEEHFADGETESAAMPSQEFNIPAPLRRWGQLLLGAICILIILAVFRRKIIPLLQHYLG